jgi:hypothetical protein
VLPSDRPFTTAQALAAGLTRAQLRGSEYVQVLHGVHAPRIAMSPSVRALTRVRAALLTHPPSAAASHGSAARVLGAPVPPEPVEHVTVPRPDDRRRRVGVRCHVAALGSGDVEVLAGVRVTAPHRLFLDLAECLGLVDLVVLGDWLVGRGLATPESLTAYCAGASCRGACAARRAAAYVRARVDSPMETRLRLLLVLAGLPEPEVNRELRDPRGFLLARLDLSWRGLRIAVEYDGRHHHTSTAQWERDVERRNDLTASGWLLITVTSAGIYRDPGDTLRRVHEALVRRGGSRTRLRDGWRAHFPAA